MQMAGKLIIRCMFYSGVVCLSVAMRSRGSEADYVHESKPMSVDQSAQQQCLMSSVYLPTNNYLYHNTDVDRDLQVKYMLTSLLNSFTLGRVNFNLIYMYVVNYLHINASIFISSLYNTSL